MKGFITRASAYILVDPKSFRTLVTPRGLVPSNIIYNFNKIIASGLELKLARK